MLREKLKKYRKAMLETLAPVRNFLAENKLTSGLYHWIKDCFYHHKVRIFLGILLLIVELGLFFGSGIMREDVTNYLTGEGSWGEQVTDETPVFCQAFTPKYSQLHSLSFLMGMNQVSEQDGSVTIRVSDQNNEILYEETKGFSDIVDGAFTDVKVDLELSPHKTYYLSIISSPSSAGEYPTVWVCSKSYKLSENRTLTQGDELADIQLVARYEYQDVMTASMARNIILLCLLTALGVMFGLPDNRWLRKAVGVVILIVLPLALGRQLELVTFNEVMYLENAMKWNVAIMYGLELVILLCTHSPGLTGILMDVVLTILYSVNYFTNMYRGTHLHMNDFTAIGTAAKVAGSYDLTPNGCLAMAWGIAFLLLVFGVQTGAGAQERQKRRLRPRGRKYWVTRLASYGVTIAVAAGMVWYGGYQLLYTDLLERSGFMGTDFPGFYYELIYSFDGYMVATCLDIKNSRITAPEGYSVAQVEELLQAAQDSDMQAAEEDLPHVILIMNESFSDLRVLGDLELNQDNLTFFNSLEDNTVRGYVNASVLGGGTANSEFEVFTGCSMAFFPANYYPYQQGIKKPLNSMVSWMEQYGYTTYSMHPEPASNWNRENVYKHYGFDESLWKKNFEGAEEIHSGVSDAETYKKVIELYENREPEEKMFIFDLTMQNHAYYWGNEGPYEVQETRLQKSQIDEYLSLIKISDEAFEDLIGYFEKQDEKVIICMFGDHQPYLSRTIVGDEDQLSAEQKLNMYKTPFVIWANYDIDEADDYDISMNYLGGLLLRTAGLPLSPYFTFLEKQREEYPIVTLNGYVDSEGNVSSWSGEDNELLDYRMLQYNYLFDKNIVEWGY
jgi:hypothetical protein